MALEITGIGAISALGSDAPSLFSGLVAGRSGLSPVAPAPLREFRCGWLGLADAVGFDGLAAGQSRTARMALSAAREAMVHARLEPRVSRVGLVVGGSTAGMLETEELLVTLADADATDAARSSALEAMLSHPLSAVTDWVAERLGPFAMVATVSSACSSGVTAAVVGASWLTQGLVDAVVVGAADGLCRVVVAGFGALGALDEGPCRPFDRRRRGLSLGEGAGFVVVERGEHAARRGAIPRASLAGWALVAEAHHLTNPEPSGARAARAIEAALDRAGVDGGEVDWVNAHGTGTRLNDPMECRAVGRALGQAASTAPISSIKGSVGHTLAAAGALECVVAVQAIGAQRIPPTVGLEQLDDECVGRHVTGDERSTIDAVVSSSFAFGGMDGALVIAAPGHARTKTRGACRLVIARAATVDVEGLRGAGAVVAEPRAEGEGSGLEGAVARLDAARARRMDRASLLAAVAAESVLDGVSLDRDAVGVVLGSAFGRADATAQFMARVRERGPRFASPVEFPSLLPSAAAGHVSLYHRLGGPALAAADLAASGEAAFCLACDLLATGEAAACVAGATEEASRIVEGALASAFRTSSVDGARRGEGAATLLVATESAAEGAGLASMARVIAWRRSAVSDGVDLSDFAPTQRSLVVVGRMGARAADWLARSAWSAVPVRALAPERGSHEALGAFALAVAAELIGSGERERVLVVGEGSASLYCVVLER